MTVGARQCRFRGSRMSRVRGSRAQIMKEPQMAFSAFPVYSLQTFPTRPQMVPTWLSSQDRLPGPELPGSESLTRPLTFWLFVIEGTTWTWTGVPPMKTHHVWRWNSDVIDASKLQTDGCWSCSHGEKTSLTKHSRSDWWNDDRIKDQLAQKDEKWTEWKVRSSCITLWHTAAFIWYFYSNWTFNALIQQNIEPKLFCNACPLLGL